MSFLENKPTTFKPAIDPFGGRGKQGGLTHGGQYSVDYVLAEEAKKNKAKITPFLKDTPPVSTPVPTKQEKARMRSESVATPKPKKQKKARMQNASGESFKNVSGKEREEIREYLKGYTCFTKPKDGYPDPCNGMHAKWQVDQGNCEGGQSAIDKLQRCAESFYGDPDTGDGAKKNVKACTRQEIDLNNSLEKKKTNEILMEYSVQYRNELEQKVEACYASREQGVTPASGNFTYGCMAEEADNYNPQANVENGSCTFSPASFQPDGTFYENQGEINDAVQPYFDGNLPLGDPNIKYAPPQSYPPSYEPQVKQGGFSMNPLLIIGALAAAGLVMFMINRPAPQPIQAV